MHVWRYNAPTERVTEKKKARTRTVSAAKDRRAPGSDWRKRREREKLSSLPEHPRGI